MDNIIIRHCVITKNSNFDVDIYPFISYLTEKFEKFISKYNVDFMCYTIGTSGKFSTVAVNHPFDDFIPKNAEDIVRGRILRMQGLLRNKNGEMRKQYPQFEEKNEELIETKKYLHVSEF